MTPYTLHHGDCLAILRTLPDASVDAVVTDPPYGLSFMGKRWDYDVPSTEVWAECLRVLKPGGHLLAFAGTRTQHRMAVRIEDAGFDIRDLIAWVYASGFPKSLDVSKAIDREAGAKRETKRVQYRPQQLNCKHGQNERPWRKAAAEAGFHELPGDEPATDAARAWQGWGTALKPALEPITVARKPLDGTVAENVLAHGTGALNVDGCRVEASAEDVTIQQTRTGGKMGGDIENDVYQVGWKRQPAGNPLGRWPANLIHDGSEEVVGLFPETHASHNQVRTDSDNSRAVYGGGYHHEPGSAKRGFDDPGSAARFFYCAKASKADRDAGCEGLPQTVQQSVAHGDKAHGTLPYTNEPREMNPRPRTNHHPTVKPTDLMRYLCRLVTPPGGVILDPFTGSGSTGRGAILEGFRFIGIEREADYITIARARIEDAVAMRAREAAQLTML